VRLKPLWPGLSRPLVVKTYIPRPAAKAAALMEGIIIRHPWLDGNKRTGLGLALFLLLRAGIRMRASQDELYDMTIRVAEGKSSVAEIQEWIEAHIA